VFVAADAFVTCLDDAGFTWMERHRCIEGNRLRRPCTIRPRPTVTRMSAATR
jgi:hypothetical protein